MLFISDLFINAQSYHSLQIWEERWRGSLVNRWVLIVRLDHDI